MAGSTGPDIVTDGLIFSVDAANKKSYPGSGTSMTDLSGNGNTGRLFNGPTFGSGNSGFINLDGTNDMIIISNGWNTSGASECFWWRNDSSNDWNGSFFGQSTSAQKVARLVGTTTLRYYGQNSGYDYTVPTMALNTWYHAVFSDNGTNARVYLNGIESTTGQQNTQPMNINQIGRYHNGGATYDFEGDIASFRGYNRALTAAEVLQNYNATKSRFI
tara:strand:+ start:28 stop:678 length:651 start_codon:yes stop_codon:yes gene_type:complete